MIPPFIFFDTPALPGAGFILSTSWPFYIGKVYKFKTDSEMEDFSAQKKASGFYVAGKPYGYRIIISYFNSLEKPPDIANNQTVDAVAKVFRQMADFYLTEKINPRPAAYKRYLENEN